MKPLHECLIELESAAHHVAEFQSHLRNAEAIADERTARDCRRVMEFARVFALRIRILIALAKKAANE